MSAVLFALIAVVVFSVIALVEPALANRLTRENGVVEWLQVSAGGDWDLHRRAVSQLLAGGMDGRRATVGTGAHGERRRRRVD